MTIQRISALMAASLLALQPVIASADSPAATPPVVTPPAGIGPSAFVRCDGSPNKASSLATTARLLAITAVVGLLIPAREAADPKKRQSGTDGIKACDDALNGKDPAKDGGRRIELIFGRAIHRMEAKDWAGAIADIHAVSTDQPELTKTTAYTQSLGITALHLEAIALVGKGDYPAANSVALKMAEQAPYDLVNMLAVTQFSGLSDGYDAQAERFYDQLVRIYPTSLLGRAQRLALVRRFAEAAQDQLTVSKLLDSIPKIAGYSTQARAAIGLRLAGNPAEADRVLASAQERADKDLAAGKSDTNAAQASEAADFYAIVVALDAGQALRARTLFSAHTHWATVPAGYAMEISRRLAKVGTPAEQQLTPIQSPVEIFAAEQKRAAGVITYAGEDNERRFAAYRLAFSPTEFNRFAGDVWRIEKSRFIAEKPNDTFKATLVDVSRDGGGFASGYAMLLHLALAAKARGADGFMMLPGQQRVYSCYVRIGKASDPDMFAPIMFNPDKVIADLSPLIPKPEPRK